MRKVLLILGQLSDEDVEWLAGVGRREVVPAGRTLVEEGRPIDRLYFLLDGQMSVSVAGLGAVATLEAGEVIGEMSLIDTRPPSASVAAVQDAIVLAVPRRELEARFAVDAAFAARFYRAIATFLSERLRGTVRRLGFGEGGSLAEEAELAGELDENVLDNLHLAGARFDRIIKHFLGRAA